MINLKDEIDSLSNFKRNTADFLRQLKRSGKPVVLTINGKAELVVQDAASYQRLMEIAERIETIEVLRPSIEEMKRRDGEGSSGELLALKDDDNEEIKDEITVEQRIERFNRWARTPRDLPDITDEALRRENIYPDRN